MKVVCYLDFSSILNFKQAAMKLIAACLFSDNSVNLKKRRFLCYRISSDVMFRRLRARTEF